LNRANQLAANCDVGSFFVVEAGTVIFDRTGVNFEVNTEG